MEASENLLMTLHTANILRSCQVPFYLFALIFKWLKTLSFYYKQIATNHAEFTCPRLPHILAWMEGYICFSFIVIVISLSRIAVTRWRLASSLCLQNRTRLDSQGVIYSRQRCFSSIPEIKIHFVTRNQHWSLCIAK